MTEGRPWCGLAFRRPTRREAAQATWGAVRAALVLAALLAAHALLAGIRTLSLGEEVWLAVGVWGLTLAQRNLVAAVGDLRFVGRRRLNGGRRIVARNNVRREAVKVAKCLCLIGVGLVAASRPPAALVPHSPPTALLAPLLIIAVELLIVSDTYFDRRERVALLSLLNAIYKAKPSPPPANAPTAEPGGIET